MDDIDRLSEPDAQLILRLRAHWLNLMDCAVWGDIKSEKLGAVSKLRKRLLELGERLRSVAADRTWIPKPRERLKNALGSCLNLRETLVLVERAAQELVGGNDLPAFSGELIAFHRLVLTELQAHETAWAAALENINKEALADDRE
ncbi:MAG: hypothetical protein M0Z44_03715 [Gammaproteobacteria bacterium]|nr:hypothetical protein [Gammaproteobacteria bacterium]